jgi:hypothetical protein
MTVLGAGDGSTLADRYAFLYAKAWRCLSLLSSLGGTGKNTFFKFSIYLGALWCEPSNPCNVEVIRKYSTIETKFPIRN